MRCHSGAVIICEMSSDGDSQITLGEILALTQHNLSPESEMPFTRPCPRAYSPMDSVCVRMTESGSDHGMS